MLRFLLFSLATGLARGLPLPLLYRVADLVGTACAYVDLPRARPFRDNLQHLAGPGTTRRDARRLARRGYRHMAMYLGEFFSAPRYERFHLTAQVRVHGAEHLAAAHAGGRGIIVCSAHYSNWELAASTVGYLGYPIRVIALQHEDPRANELFLRPRRHNGVVTLDVHKEVRMAYRILRENGVVAVMADRDVKGTGVDVEFFGRRMRFPQGPARMCMSSGAAIVFTFIRRRADRSYDQVFYPPIYPDTSEDRDEAVHRMTQQFARIVEHEVALDPTQYTVFFPIWNGTVG